MKIIAVHLTLVNGDCITLTPDDAPLRGRGAPGRGPVEITLDGLRDFLEDERNWFEWDASSSTGRHYPDFDDGEEWKRAVLEDDIETRPAIMRVYARAVTDCLTVLDG